MTNLHESDEVFLTVLFAVLPLCAVLCCCPYNLHGSSISSASVTTTTTTTSDGINLSNKIVSGRNQRPATSTWAPALNARGTRIHIQSTGKQFPLGEQKSTFHDAFIHDKRLQRGLEAVRLANLPMFTRSTVFEHRIRISLQNWTCISIHWWDISELAPVPLCQCLITAAISLHRWIM